MVRWSSRVAKLDVDKEPESILEKYENAWFYIQLFVLVMYIHNFIAYASRAHCWTSKFLYRVRPKAIAFNSRT